MQGDIDGILSEAPSRSSPPPQSRDQSGLNLIAMTTFSKEVHGRAMHWWSLMSKQRPSLSMERRRVPLGDNNPRRFLGVHVGERRSLQHREIRDGDAVAHGRQELGVIWQDHVSAPVWGTEQVLELVIHGSLSCKPIRVGSCRALSTENLLQQGFVKFVNNTLLKPHRCENYPRWSSESVAHRARA